MNILSILNIALNQLPEPAALLSH